MSPYARIVGVGGHLPQRVMENDEWQQYIDTSDEWIRSRSGIQRRHIAAEGELASDLALPAAQQALANAQLAAGALDMIIVATTTPDRIYPATACLLQAKLGAAGCAAFDVQAVCSGFMYALSIGEAMIVAGRAKKILVVGAEVYSHILDWTDRGTCVLFGDGAGAAVLTASATPGILATRLHADGNYADKLTVNAHVKGGELLGDGHTRMDGATVYRFAVEKMTEAAKAVAGDNEIDWLVLHQANRRIIDTVRKRLQVPEEKTVFSVRDHGNTSAASIPLALAERAADFKGGDRLLLAAVGGGFTWGATYLQW
ncbi:MAG: ketoacyl-ACP synthase III [Proteobacteria bacterium]|nr:ketoacyl-ACP synthase III [Pseudomonadota bacterium]